MMRLLKTLDKLDRDHKNEPNPPEDHP
jgi:hypothetical protein